LAEHEAGFVTKPTLAMFVFGMQGFGSSAACKASGLSLYRNLRRPFSFPSEERVGSPPFLVPTRILTFG
jgi:hypothetical protein